MNLFDRPALARAKFGHQNAIKLRDSSGRKRHPWFAEVRHEKGIDWQNGSVAQADPILGTVEGISDPEVFQDFGPTGVFATICPL